MLNERSKLILKLLCEKNSVSLDDIIQLFGVSQRTIRNDLDNIDSFLQQHSFETVQKSTVVNYSIDDNQGNILKQLQNEQETQKEFVNYWEEPNFRVGFIYSKLFWQGSRVTIDYLCDTLSVSRSTINTDLKRLKEIAHKTGIEVVFDKQKGFLLEASELKKRNLYFEFLKFLKQFSYDFEIVTNDNQMLISQWLRDLEKALMLKFTYTSFKRLITKINVIVKRIMDNRVIEPSNHEIEIPNYEIHIVTEAIRNLENLFMIRFTTAELNYLAQQVYASSQIKNEVVAKGYNVQINMMVSEFIEMVSTQLKINLALDDDLFNYLALHFKTTLTKSEYATSTLITKETFDGIRNSYSSIYNHVKTSIELLNDETFFAFKNEHEYMFLTLHIVSSIEKIKDKMAKQLHILLVCHMGVGTSQFLKYRLSQALSAHLEIATVEDISQKIDQSDMIISTVNLDDLTIPYVKTSPLLTGIDLKKVEQLQTTLINRKIIKQRKEVKINPMLKELLTTDTIATGVEVNSWEEAIVAGGHLLEKNSFIEPQYTQAMIGAVKKFGPYIVIAPHIALAHASSKDGVNEISMSLSILDRPVAFGNQENDPVNIVICLAAIDHHSHLKALSELVKKLTDETFINILNSADKEKIIAYIEQNTN